MNNVFKRAQKKRLEHKLKTSVNSICEQSQQDSELLMSRFDELVTHLSGKEGEDIHESKRKLQESHRHHHR
ncbi:hypothetical protein EDI28_10360 [Photobacterium chitinilyticum]|uniref:Uncharacterized protein n=1 Tax=Photobacterium chitinilyticum TaxID=2485123 RepID=A0A3S3S1K2_9GAMM|nr:hypothetical protein EDI28_10360 [Photobacterium chitinilyticum]